ncbi:hypothetical protein EBU99_12710 [bacterium]|nr:hypothetical protein [bacterium]
MSRKSIHSTRGHTRATKGEVIITRVAVGVALTAAFFATFALGIRTRSKQNSLHDKVSRVLARLRGWEKPAELEMNAQKTDTRTHVGFHFNWERKFNAPVWELASKNANDRPGAIVKHLEIGHSKLKIVSIDGERTNLFSLIEPLAKDGSASLSKNILPLLPGERLSLSYPLSAGSGRGWKLRVRALAVTQDRLDAPLILNNGIGRNELGRSEVDPRGQALDIEIPSLAELQRRGEKIFTLEWPKESSGLLSIEGFQPTSIDGEQRTQLSRAMIIHIDSMNTSLTQLHKTIEILKNATLPQQNLIHLTTVIPPSDDFKLAQKAILTSRMPIELAATLQNPKLQHMLAPSPIMLNRYLNKGGSVRKIRLETRQNPCSDCDLKDASDPSENAMTTTLNISRRQEFASTSELLRNDEFITDPGLLFVEVQVPAQSLRLNWESAISSEKSLPAWLFAGVRELFGQTSQKYKDSEKVEQLDSWLARAIESFFVTSNSANLALILHNNQLPIELDKQTIPQTQLTRGEALLSINDLRITDGEKDKILAQKAEVSLQSVVKTFEKLSSAKNKLIPNKELIESFTSEPYPTTQLTNHSFITYSTQGWLADEIPGQNALKIRPLFRAESDKIYQIQDRSNSDRRRSRLLGLHVFLPAVNNKDEVIQISLASQLKTIGCESQSENAQLTEKSAEEPGVSPDNSFEIVGRRTAQSVWHLFCLVDGRVSSATHLKLSFKINNTPVARERIGLGEFALPVRGFLWHSPDSIELVGAQISDATIALAEPDKEAIKDTSVIVWTEHIPGGLGNARAAFSVFAENKSAQQRLPEVPNDRLSEK